MNNNHIQRITPKHSRSPSPITINRITPNHSRSASPETECIVELDTSGLECIAELDTSGLECIAELDTSGLECIAELVTSIIESPPLEPSLPPSPEKLSSTSPWIKHLRVCTELYGVKYNYAIKCGELRLLYYTKSNRDMDGNILYPAKLQMFGTPSENALVRTPWTGIAIRNPSGYSHDAVII